MPLRAVPPLLLLVLCAQPLRAEVLVDSVEPGSAGELADLRVGDRLDAWHRAEAEGSLEDPAAFQRMLWTQAPLATLELRGARGDVAMRWQLGAGRVGVTVRPVIVDSPRVDPILDAWQQAETLEEAGDLAGAREAILAALRPLAASEQPLLVAALSARAGVLSRRMGDLDGAEAQLDRALGLRRAQAPGSHAVGETLRDLHLCAFARGDLERADALASEAIAVFEQLPASRLDAARARNDRGRVYLVRGQHEEARKAFEAALGEFEHLAADPLDTSRALTNLGVLARRSGDLTTAQDRFEAALAIHEELDPSSRGTGVLLNNLGAVAYDRGDLVAAESYVGRALALREAADPGTLGVALFLSNLGGLTLERGDLAQGELLLLRALEIRRAKAPHSIDEAATLESLAAVYSERGELGRAREAVEQALAISTDIAPGGADEAGQRHNLAQIALRQGDLPEAAAQLEQALALREKLAPRGPSHAATLAALADLELQRENLDAARQRIEAALAIDAEIAAGGLTQASHLLVQASILSALGQHDAAIASAERASRLRSLQIPGTHWDAQAWHTLARVQRAAGHTQLALDSAKRACQILDQLGTRASGLERGRLGFRARQADIYADCIRWQWEEGDLAGALESLERSRARVFLEMLAERDLDYQVELPLALRAKRRRNRSAYDRALRQLLEDQEVDSAYVDSLQSEYERIELEVRATAPSLAALEQPRTLSAQEVQAELADGTALLAYLVADESTLLFAVDASGMDVVEIPRTRAEWRELVQAFRQRIAGRLASEAQGGEMFELLIQPVLSRIAQADRLLISPDGPLRVLPFAALRGPDPEQYLVEWKPLHFTNSVSVYAELRLASPPRGQRIAVFAAPEPMTEDSSIALALNREAPRGRAFGTLSNARREADNIVTLFADRPTELFTAAKASEAQAKSLNGDYALIHFATHGITQSGGALGSSLILSPGSGGENGLLQAAEILESLRVRADLVTLSACETALGEDFGGEGLLGLVRAFQHAGAQSVVASLWAVADAPTAELMGYFYAALRDGQAKDDALRQAQLLMLHSKDRLAGGPARGVGGIGDETTTDARHPFYWAAFELFGGREPSLLAKDPD